MKNLAFALIFAFSSVSTLQALAQFNESSKLRPKVRLGFIGYLEGRQSRVSNELLKGVELFFQEIPNAKDAIEVAKYGLSDGEFISEINKQIDKMHVDKILFAFGLPSSEHAITFGKLAKPKQITLLTPFATSIRLSEFDSIKTFAADSKLQASALLKLIYLFTTATSKKFLIIDQHKSLSGTEVAKIIKEELTAKEINPITYDFTGKLDLTEIGKLIETENIGAIFFSSGGEESLLSIIEIEKITKERKLKYFGSDNFGAKPVIAEVLSKYFSDLEKRFFYTTHWDPILNDSKSFVLAFLKKFPNDHPTSGARISYLAVDYFYKYLKSKPKKIDSKSFHEFSKRRPFNAVATVMTISNGLITNYKIE